MPINVHDIMTTPVYSIAMDDSLESIQHAFDSKKFHHVMVAGDDGECVGVISDRDLLKNLSPFLGKFSERSADAACLKRRAHQIMTRSLVSARPNTALRAAVHVMLEGRISCMPVVDANKKCVGIITLRDVVRWAMSEMEQGTQTPRSLPKAA